MRIQTIFWVTAGFILVATIVVIGVDMIVGACPSQ